MGLMDKVKAQASTLAQKTQETANAAQAKIDSAQASRRADGMLRSLGLAYLAERTGRATPETSAQIDKLLADLAQHEGQHNVNLVQQSAAAQQMQMQTGPGDFLTSSQVATDPNVSGAPVSFPQEAGPVPTGFPEATPATSFPQSGGPAGFPQATPATSFPQSGGPAGFGEATPPATYFPQPGEPAGFGQATPPATYFPQPGEPAAPPATFPESAPGYEQADEAGGFPPASGG